ncbi:MAG: LamB/YcsF family protein, partial [Parvibaculaceae bacterium]
SSPDFMGFGRRTMGLTEQEVFEITVYQIGALHGFCLAENVRMTHVKPHGQLYLTGVRDEATARGIVRAVAAVDPELLLLMYGGIVAAECEAAGVTLVHEGYVDLEYFADGSLVLDKAREARSPDQIAARALSLVEKGGVEAVDGSWLTISTQSICLHGDMANAPELAAAVRLRLEGAGYEIVGLREMAKQAGASKIAASG